MSDLNPEQQKASEFTDGVCVVIAVPGSGKTRTMMERIGILVNKHGIPPENILGLTFTRNAADEMRHRLVPVLGEMSSRVFLTTIHSFCYTLLRSEGIVFEILSGREQMIFIKEVIKKLKIREVSAGMVLGEISLAKNNLIGCEEFRVMHAGDRTMVRIADIYEAYDREKSARMLMDFDDLLVRTHDMLNNRIDIREKYQEVFCHLLVDEFQDTNPAQMEILKLLIPENRQGSFWCTGDDHQAIFSFTGASVGNIIHFKSIFPDSQQMILHVNYRSTPQILAACQNLIRHNEKQIHKTLKTDNPDGEEVIVLESSSEETEAINLVHEIQTLKESTDYDYQDMAVLYRCNFQSRIIEEVFSQHKIPYHIENGLCFYDRREVKILLDYLRVISSPETDEGDEALAGILNVPNRYIGRKFIGELRSFAAEKQFHLYRALKELPVTLPYIRKNIQALTGFLDPLISEAGHIRPAEAISLVRTSLDIDRYVSEEDMPSPDDVKIQNMDQLLLSAARYDDIRAFLDYAAGFQNESVSDNREGVSLMTIHKAKGLEFPVVFLVGMVEGILPTRRNENIEEERRICFVAISRAMHLLYLSHYMTCLGQAARTSRFLCEILGQETDKKVSA
ncbi:ATP-dependent helicase [Desulfosudis oleivorans]|uniref:DNA 3'-5' helicase n=1 Tax=Desulfosudis oleivorans (strain DSM 6200 / JCM 39069 / Hxd3) TaxID=96561 RepID=A8ZYJ7_DESOH|nr:UvrD-helicase domain-containing protein [Desulfosudis oleivorans]ABW68722.1 UvrD/REP helicase [Desulfosudis oleivorans Hxd3]